MAGDRDTAKEWVERLGLEPHPEGGFYRETYRSDELIGNLPHRYCGLRAFGTAIYFLLRAGEVSRLHRLRSDEIWHWYGGGALVVGTLSADGTWTEHRLGFDWQAGERPQLVVARGAWFGAWVAAGGDFALVGCTVAPGFDFADFEFAGPELAARYPQHRQALAKLIG